MSHILRVIAAWYWWVRVAWVVWSMWYVGCFWVFGVRWGTAGLYMKGMSLMGIVSSVYALLVVQFPSAVCFNHRICMPFLVTFVMVPYHGTTYGVGWIVGLVWSVSSLMSFWPSMAIVV